MILPDSDIAKMARGLFSREENDGVLKKALSFGFEDRRRRSDEKYLSNFKYICSTKLFTSATPNEM